MKISIVIPAYNEEGVLAETLRHATTQAYPDYEVIVVNNASTDGTDAIARSFLNVRVVLEPNKGLLHARERGRTEATGELIANMDADCLPAPDWLTRGAQAFVHPHVVAITGPYDYYDGGALFRYSSLFLQTTVYPLLHFIIHRIFGKGAILIGGNNMVRKSALDHMAGYDTSILFYGEDTDTGKKLAQEGTVLYKNSFRIKTSARRFKKMGVLQVSYLYLMNYLWVTCFGKPYTTE